MKRRRRKRLHQDPAAALLSHSPYVHSITPRHTSRRWATPTRARSNHVGRSTTITASQIRSFILSRGGEPRQLHFGAVERAPSKTKRPSSASRARKVLQEEHSGNAAARQFALIAAQGDGSTRSTASRSDVLLATVLGHGTLPVEPMSHHTMISEEQRKSPSLQQAASKRPAHAAQQDAACPAPQTSAAARRHSVKSHPDHWIQQQQGPQQQQENPVRGVHIAGPPVFPVTRARCKERGASPNEKGRSSKTRKIRKRSTLRGTEGTVRRRLRAAIEQANSAVHGAPGAWTKHDKDRTQAQWGVLHRAVSGHVEDPVQEKKRLQRLRDLLRRRMETGQAVPSTLTIQPGAVPMDRVYKVLENAIRPPPVRPLYALLGSPKAHHGVGAPHTSHSAQRVSRYTLRQCPGWHSAIPGRLSHVLRGVLEALLDRALLDLCSHKNCPHRTAGARNADTVAASELLYLFRSVTRGAVGMTEDIFVTFISACPGLMSRSVRGRSLSTIFHKASRTTATKMDFSSFVLALRMLANLRYPDKRAVHSTHANRRLAGGAQFSMSPTAGPHTNQEARLLPLLRIHVFGHAAAAPHRASLVARTLGHMRDSSTALQRWWRGALL